MSLTAARTNFQNMTNLVTKIGRPLLHGVTFWNGALVALDGATRYLKPNTGAAGDLIVGCADLKQHPSVVAHASTDGGISGNGTTTIDVITGIFPFLIGTSGDVLAQTDVGNFVFGIDDQTVGKTDGATGRPVAGRLVRLETLNGISVAWVAVAMSLGDGGGSGVGGANGSVDARSTAGACSVATDVTELTIGSTLAFTLAAGVRLGQEKTIVCVATSGSPVGTLTSPSSSGWTTISGLGAKGASVTLKWTVNGWDIMGGLTVTVA
jgi:hypothetical protein